MNPRALLWALLLFVLSLGCDGGGEPFDAGSDPTDASVSMRDGAALDGSTPRDAGSPDAYVVPPDELEITPLDPPISVEEGTVFATLAYGPGSRQVMDVFLLPDAAEPTPVVIYIHGGGFVAGSRTSGYGGGSASRVQTLLSAGVAFITIDYTLLQPGLEEEGVIKCLRDARRALQFVRYYAAPLNIDPSRIGLSGESAGAGTSLWLAFHDDMADPGSEDVIARESTRVQVAAVNASQATYELFRWPSDVFSPTYPMTVEGLLSQPSLAGQVATFYGQPLSLVSEPETLEANLRTPEYEAYRAEVDMLAWMSADDPPFYVRNQAPDRAPDESGFDLLHHPLHASTLHDRAVEVELEHIVEAPALGLGGDTSTIDYLVDHLLP